MYFFAFIIIISFSMMNFIEVSSYLARISGVILGKKALATSLQNAVFMFTRFFALALMPVIGFSVDKGIDRHFYLAICIFSFLSATLSSLIAIHFRNRIISGFVEVVELINSGGGMLFSLMKLPIFVFKKNNGVNSLPQLSFLIGSRIFWLSSFLFFIYSVSAFVVFFIALIYPDYRTTITQLSGVMNGFATVLLTFFVEPKLSLIIDNEEDINVKRNSIYSMILGRVLGVGFYSSSLFCILYFVF